MERARGTSDRGLYVNAQDRGTSVGGAGGGLDEESKSEIKNNPIG